MTNVGYQPWTMVLNFLFYILVIGIVLKTFCIPKNLYIVLDWPGMTKKIKRLGRPESRNDMRAGTIRNLEWHESSNDQKAGMTWELKQPESWNYMRAQTIRNLEWHESSNDQKAGMTWELKQPESWNCMRAQTIRKLEWHESWNDQKAGMTWATGTIRNFAAPIYRSNKCVGAKWLVAPMCRCKMVSSTNVLVQDG